MFISPVSESGRRARNALSLVLFLFFLVACFSLVRNLTLVKNRYSDLAKSVGVTFFQMTLITHRWNSIHGGVYVPVTDEFQPNPYLDDPLRDLQTEEGLALTKINPAYMTRLIGELLAESEGVQLHLTSLNPINPGNAPDDWEKTALEAFEDGDEEVSETILDESNPLFRYMAPLFVEEPCLTCHARQGYELGDIRGGISVLIPYSPFLAAVKSGSGQIILAHTLLFIISAIVILVLIFKLTTRIDDLQAAQAHIDRLEGILPVCANCGKIRSEGKNPGQQQSWQDIEAYLREMTRTEFSHGICPDCMQKLYPDFPGQ